MSEHLTIPSRFCGPARSGNGGYTAGVLAQRVPPAGSGTGQPEDTPAATLEVSLRQPPPLDVAMQVAHLSAEDPTNTTGGELTVLLMGGAKIAEAAPSTREIEPVESVPAEVALEASEGFAGFTEHPFPTCFVCGTGRQVGDGLRIFPGPVPGDPGDARRVAAAWTPDPALAEISDVLDPGTQRVGAGVAWGALDCVGSWSADVPGRRMVLARMTAQVDALPLVGEPHVVVGVSRGVEGRKTFTSSTLYDADGRIVARAAHLWIAVDPSAFN